MDVWSWVFSLVPGGIGYNVATIQMSLTIGAVCLDVWLAIRVFWIPFVRNVRKEDRPYLFSRIGIEAREERIRAEQIARIKR